METNINILELGKDLFEAKNAKGYDEQFRVKLLSMEHLSPFRAYLHYQDAWWPITVILRDYPITLQPLVRFEGRLPPCPKHAESWHPNIFNDGKVCWGGVQVFPEMRAVGLMHMLYGMLHNPNHASPVPGRCNILTDVTEQATVLARHAGRRLLGALEEAERRYRSGDWPNNSNPQS